MPAQVSPSGNRENCMPVGGNGNNGLQQLGEEEEKLQQEKKLNEDYTVDINTDNENLRLWVLLLRFVIPLALPLLP